MKFNWLSPFPGAYLTLKPNFDFLLSQPSQKGRKRMEKEREKRVRPRWRWWIKMGWKSLMMAWLLNFVRKSCANCWFIVGYKGGLWRLWKRKWWNRCNARVHAREILDKTGEYVFSLNNDWSKHRWRLLGESPDCKFQEKEAGEEQEEWEYRKLGESPLISRRFS